MDTQIADLKFSHKQAGIWDAWLIREHTSPAELITMLKKQDRQYQGMDDFDCIEAIIAGALRQVQPRRDGHVFNKITLGLRGDTWGARLVNGHTSNESGILYYLSIGTNNTDPSESQTALLNEIFRDTPITKRNSGAQQSFHMFVDHAEGNPGVSTAIAASPASTKTVLEVDSATGFSVGDAIEVGTSPASGRSRITAITGDQLTLDPTQPLLYLPVEGNTVTLIIGESGSHGNEDASTTPDSGTLFSRGGLKLLKTIDYAALIRHTFLGVSG